MKQHHRIAVFVFYICSAIAAQANETAYTTQIFAHNIKTLQAKANGNALSLPVITLNGDDKLMISFDEMSHEGHSFFYEIIHCNADWTRSSLSIAEYMQQSSRSYIADYALSVNTTFLYTNYRFELPNDDIQFNVSGNYIVSIFENTDSQNPVATLQFYVVEPKVDIQGSVRGHTDTELNNTKQQLDFEVITGNYRIADAHSELKVTVRQNDRSDNAVTELKPTYYSANKLSYINNRQLIFDGGNEYRRIDFSSIYNFDERIDSIRFIRPHYEVFAAKNHAQNDIPYHTDFDVNGRYVINNQNAYHTDTEADYMYVHLQLKPHSRTWTQGDVYIGGAWNYNQLNEAARMNFDPYNNLYSKILLLKQGGYNYQYWFTDKNSKNIQIAPMEGSHWQTQNEYAIYLYYRPWGARYDQLIGFKTL